MIRGLQRFIERLRIAGLSISPAESIDAVRAVERVGIGSRERMREALVCTLVKRSDGRAVLEREFDRFFVPPRRGVARGEDGDPAGGGEGSGRGSGGTAGREPSPRREAAAERASAAWGEGTGRPRAVSRPTRPLTDPGGSRGLIDRGGPSTAGAAVSLPRDGSRRGRLRRVVLSPPRSDRRAPATARVDPSRRDLRERMEAVEEGEIAALVPRCVETLRLRSGRRQGDAARGALNLRRLFRANLGHGGAPFVLPRRRPRPARRRVTLLVDVSWSTARAAGLFLSLAAEFLRRAADTRVFLFVDRACEATDEVVAWLRERGRGRSSTSGLVARPPAPFPGEGITRGGTSFAALLRAVDGLNLAAPSDYGRVFDGLERSRRRPGGRDSVLVVLGDGRTNQFDPQAWAFESLAEASAVVIWMVPEGARSWNTGDSALDRYLPHVDVAVEARDLDGLSRGVAELARRL